jgi:transcriptional regulator with XRE-family HTH domain
MDNIGKLQNEIRQYLKNHPSSQRELAHELDISLSWLSKFVSHAFNNPTSKRLSHLADWMSKDTAKRLSTQSA